MADLIPTSLPKTIPPLCFKAYQPSACSTPPNSPASPKPHPLDTVCEVMLYTKPLITKSILQKSFFSTSAIEDLIFAKNYLKAETKIFKALESPNTDQVLKNMEAILSAFFRLFEHTLDEGKASESLFSKLSQSLGSLAQRGAHTSTLTQALTHTFKTKLTLYLSTGDDNAFTEGMYGWAKLITALSAFSINVVGKYLRFAMRAEPPHHPPYTYWVHLILGCTEDATTPLSLNHDKHPLFDACLHTLSKTYAQQAFSDPWKRKGSIFLDYFSFIEDTLHLPSPAQAASLDSFLTQVGAHPQFESHIHTLLECNLGILILCLQSASNPGDKTLFIHTALKHLLDWVARSSQLSTRDLGDILEILYTTRDPGRINMHLAHIEALRRQETIPLIPKEVFSSALFTELYLDAIYLKAQGLCPLPQLMQCLYLLSQGHSPHKAELKALLGTQFEDTYPLLLASPSENSPKDYLNALKTSPQVLSTHLEAILKTLPTLPQSTQRYILKHLRGILTTLFKEEDLLIEPLRNLLTAAYTLNPEERDFYTQALKEKKPLNPLQ